MDNVQFKKTITKKLQLPNSSNLNYPHFATFTTSAKWQEDFW